MITVDRGEFHTRAVAHPVKTLEASFFSVSKLLLGKWGIAEFVDIAGRIELGWRIYCEPRRSITIGLVGCRICHTMLIQWSHSQLKEIIS